MQQEGQKFLMDSKGKLNELQAVLAKKVHEVVEKVARDEKYDFVFEKTSSSTVPARMTSPSGSPRSLITASL